VPPPTPQAPSTTAVANDRQSALAHDHVATRGGGNATRGGLVGALGQLAARTAERSRGERFALAAIGARPNGIVHPLKGDQPPAAIADCGADFDVELLRLGQGAPNDAICFFQR